jgi:DNA ligase (NAD+)
LAETIDQLYDLKPEQVFSLYYNGRRVGENGIKAIKSLNSKKELTLDMFIGSLGIPLWGRSMVKTIMNAGFNTLEKLTMAHVDELINIQGVGPERAKTFVEGIKNKKDLIDKILSKGIIIKSNEGYLTGKSFCFTGFRNNNFETLIEQKGGTMKSGVSKDLTYLVTNDPSSATGKAAKARGYGINIIGIEELENLLNN